MGAEPIAIVGIGCRLPGGVDGPGQLWDLLMAGRDAVGEVPSERWDPYRADPRLTGALRAVTRGGSFLDDAAGFDAAFFGVTPREAELMDPQQRIVLEVAWEALEDAGIPPRGLAGTDAGVFVGVGSDDYGRQMLEDLPTIEAWSGIGAAMCAVANRVSYVLDLRGPSLAVDTACSSSLVAIHLACQSLRDGESAMALAGGVNLIAGPGLTMVLDAAGATSPDGRSKSFDAAADGYGRGEGAGVLVLKRLVDARRDGDPIRAVIRGSAVNQDGRTDGIMAPSGEAQEQVVRRALNHADVDPATVDFVEAHGTGTRMGDPIEVGALGRVYGRGRPAGGQCLIGSIKANIGHLEAGAGVAGVIKAVLALEHAVVPPTPNLGELNPSIPWRESGLRVATEVTPWPGRQPVRRAGVSGFGYGGTVSHVVLEEAPAVLAPAPEPTDPAESPDLMAGPPGRPLLFALSSAGEDGLRAEAETLRRWLTDGEGAHVPLGGVTHALLAHRSHLRCRATVVASDRSQLAAGLEALAAGEPVPGVSVGRVLGDAGPGPVWVFSGHGSQWPGMGRELLAAEPAFGEAVAAIDAVFRDEIGFSPRDVLLHGPLDDVDVIQPMIFAVQVGLSAVLRARGLAPAAVIGHSVGEIAAAVAAGVLDPRDGARLVCRRSALLRRVAGRGAMAMAGLPFAEATERLAGRTDVVAAIAASPASTVIAGTPAGVAKVTAAWVADGLLVRPVASDVAFHSPQMDPLLDDLAAAVADMTPGPSAVTLYSTALDDPRSPEPRDGSYWAGNLRNPVRLDRAVTAAAEDGHRVFVEFSPHPVVVHSVSETLAEDGHEDVYVTGTLRRGQPEVATLTGNLGGLHCHGAIAAPERLHTGPASFGRVRLPRRAWRHRPYWRMPSRSLAVGGQHDVDSGTLLGAPVSVAGASGLHVWRTYVDQGSRPYPGSHPIHGVEIVPAAVLLNTFLAAGRTRALADVRLQVPVAVDGGREVQVVLQDRGLRLASRVVASEAGGSDAEDEQSWSTHTLAALDSHDGVGSRGDRWPTLGDRADDMAARAAALPTLPPDAVAQRLRASGVSDVAFPWLIDSLAGAQGELIAAVRPHPGADGDGSALAWPSLLDAILSVAPLAFPDETLRMPAAIDRLALADALPERVAVHVRRHDDAGAETVEVTVADDDGSVVGALAGLRFARPGGDVAASVSPRRLVHEVAWRPVELPPPPRVRARTVALLGDNPLADELAGPLADTGLRCLRVTEPENLLGLLDDLGPTDAVLTLPAGVGRTDQLAEAARGAAWRLARAAQLLARHCGMHAPRLWAVTRGVRECTDPAGVADGAMWGLARVVAGEHPELWGGLIDLEAGAEAGAPALARLLRARPEPDGFAVRGGEVVAARLVPVSGEPVAEPLQCRADGTYLVTGGLGALGVEVAAWLASRGARRVVLVGRTELPPRSTWDRLDPGDRQVADRVAAIRSLEALGLTVRTLSFDVADRRAAAAALTPDALGLPPVRGVVHAAGVLDNRMLDDLDQQSLATVMRPKLEGALVLDELFPPGSVDFFVLFSSVGLQLGLTGQASYASANACLDALARHRRASGDQGTISLAWTSWRGAGMGVSDVVDRELADRGVGAVAAADALRAWEHASRYDLAYAAVVPVAAASAGSAAPVPLPILREIAGPADDDGSEAADLATELAGLDPAGRRERVLAEVTGQIGSQLKLSPADLDVRQPLTEFGLDSVMTVAIRRGLERRFGLSLPATLLWNHPTASAVADYVGDRLAERADSAAPASPPCVTGDPATST
jgi:6-methylsalicylic acid synthase